MFRRRHAPERRKDEVDDVTRKVEKTWKAVDEKCENLQA